jgi:hypothetical protein
MNIKIGKILVLISIFIGTFSCFEGRRMGNNTEIFCPDGLKILVKFAMLEDVRAAIVLAYEEKRRKGTSERETVFKLSDGRSFRIEKIPPEKMIKCSLRESRVGEAERYYWRHF